MTHKDHLFLKLAEECAEVQHRVCKIMQFGPEDIQDGQDQTNLHRLLLQINDLRAVLLILEGRNLIPECSALEIYAHHFEKNRKIKKYLELSEKLGMVKD